MDDDDMCDFIVALRFNRLAAAHMDLSLALGELPRPADGAALCASDLALKALWEAGREAD